MMFPEASVEIRRVFSLESLSEEVTVSSPFEKLYEVTVDPISRLEAFVGSEPAVVNVPDKLFAATKFAHSDGAVVQFV